MMVRSLEPMTSAPLALKSPLALHREPSAIEPPPWGVRSLSYVRDVQPIFDRACAECHQGDGEAFSKRGFLINC